jgi:WD40 repeat protein
MCSSPNSAWIISGDNNGRVKLYCELDKCREKNFKKVHNKWISAIEVTPDGKYLFTSDYDGRLVQWNIKARSL